MASALIRPPESESMPLDSTMRVLVKGILIQPTPKIRSSDKSALVTRRVMLAEKGFR
jgi:hypothetical protein